VRYGGITRVVSDVFPGSGYVDLVDGEGEYLATVHVDDLTIVEPITVPAKSCCGELLGEECDCQRAAFLAIEALNAPPIVISY
jgi:hypothetical protein